MLTDKAIQALKPREKLCRVADWGGLCLEIAQRGPNLAAKARQYLGAWSPTPCSKARRTIEIVQFDLYGPNTDSIRIRSSLSSITITR